MVCMIVHIYLTDLYHSSEFALFLIDVQTFNKLDQMNWDTEFTV